MAGMSPSIEFKMFEQLATDGWYVVDMAQHEPKIFDIVEWCRTTLGPMMISYDLDWDRVWHGGIIEQYSGGPLKTLFAFRNTADYTMLRLKFA